MKLVPLSFIRRRVRGGMLSLVLTISIVIVFIGASLITLAFYYRIQNINLDRKIRLERNALSGVSYLVGNYGISSDDIIIDLFEEGNDSVHLRYEAWGIFGVGYSKAFAKDDKQELAFLIGAKPDPYGRAAIFLADENQALHVAGKTQIGGMCFLPKAGVRRAYFRNKPHTAPQLINGEIRESSPSLPVPSRIIQTRIEQLLIPDTIYNDSINELITKRQVLHSFHNVQPLIIHSDEHLSLNNQITGKILIRSDHSIFINNNAQIENAVIIAPEVTIENGFEGVLQVFATDTMIIESNVKLRYPSVAGLIGKKTSFMEIKQFAEIEGVVFSYISTLEPSGIVKLDANASIVGQVYVNGPFQLSGVVKGSVACRRFYSELPSGVYTNHLIDAQIVNDVVMDPHFLGADFYEQSNQSGVLRWVD